MIEPVLAQGNLTRQIKRYLSAAMVNLLNAGQLLIEAHRTEEWRTRGYQNFSYYCEKELSISRSRAYDLMEIYEIAALHPEYRPRIEDTDESKLRLLLPTLRKNPADAALLDGALDEAATHTWRELRMLVAQRGDIDENLPAPFEMPCPHCGAVLKLSRAVSVA